LVRVGLGFEVVDLAFERQQGALELELEGGGAAVGQRLS